MAVSSAPGSPQKAPSVMDLSALWKVQGLKQKLIFTVSMIAVFRLGILVPVWGVHSEAVQRVANSQLLGFLDLFSGGALTGVSIMALGIGPYITASILVQLLSAVIPHFEELQKEEGEAGRRKLAQYTRYAAVGLSLMQSVLILRFIGSIPGAVDASLPQWLFYTVSVVSLMSGSLLALWISELITDRGIGNGSSLLILAGILSRMPLYATQTATLVSGNAQKSFALVALLAIYFVIIGLIIILQEASRKIPIIHAKRQRGNQLFFKGNSYIPFKINPAGVMPIIFTFALMAFPSTIIGLVQNTKPQGLVQDSILFYNRYLAPGSMGYIAIEFLLIVFFTFFYSTLIPSLQPREIADNLRKSGNAIPGVKPGRPTGEYLDAVLSRTTFIGAVALALITLVASSATSITGITTLQGLGSTSLIIMVGVSLDLVNQIRVHILSKHYEGFLVPGTPIK
jgi:preprotein translocase subunit SecY